MSSSCVLMSLPNIIRLISFSQEWLNRLTWYKTFTATSQAYFYVIAVLAFVWHLYLLKRLVQVAKKSKILWVGSAIIFWTLPMAYFGLLSYLFSLGRYHAILDFSVMLGAMIICLAGSFIIVRSVRRMVREQLKFEEFVRDSE